MQDFIAHLIDESKRFLNERSKIDDDIGREAEKFVVREIPSPSVTFETPSKVQTARPESTT